MALAVCAYSYAQERPRVGEQSSGKTHVIEPAILEVRYDSWQAEYDDSYILRIGKTANQFFSYYRYRDDSLMYTSEATMQIAIQEFIDSSGKNVPRAKKLKTSTIGNEWLYQDLHADSVMTILGMECHKATTKFRGRVWEVWFTEEIPISLGPWKLGGLPGLILKATADHDFIKFTAISIKNESINPVTFYNWGDEKFYQMTREKFLRYKNRPRTIPYTN